MNIPEKVIQAIPEDQRQKLLPLLDDWAKSCSKDHRNELQGLHSQLQQELERARELMPEDASRCNGERFLWEEDSREFEALAGLAELLTELEERLRQQ